jgi:hypothetical protein
MGKISVMRPRSADIHPVLMLLTSHRIDCCMLCLRCLERFTDLTRFKRIYVLANAVPENHRAILSRFAARHSHVTVRACLPRGLVPAVSPAQNESLAAPSRDVIVKMDEDVFVTPHWLDHLIEGYRHHAHRDDVVLATPLIPVSPPGRHVLNRFLTVSYPSERHMYVGPPVEENWVYHRWMWEKVLREGLVEAWLAERPPLYAYLDYVTINCVIYDRRLIERVHPFPVRPIRACPPRTNWSSTAPCWTATCAWPCSDAAWSTTTASRPARNTCAATSPWRRSGATPRACAASPPKPGPSGPRPCVRPSRCSPRAAFTG